MTTDKIVPGVESEMVVEVTKDLTVNRMGKPGADVLSTPALLGLMENACIDAVDHDLADGHTTVGYAVDRMRHMAPTAVGGSVRVTVVLTEVDRNRLTFEIEAFEGQKQIGSAIHKRAIVPIE